MACTFPLYVNRLRIARAIHLMVDQGMSITEACFSSGFNNLANFNRRFRAIRGVSPKQYLRQYAEYASEVRQEHKQWESIKRKAQINGHPSGQPKH